MGVLIQLSAGQGPTECALAVEHACGVLVREARAGDCTIDIVEENRTGEGLRSVVVNVDGKNAQHLAQRWKGPMLWVCALRNGNARKNWYFQATIWTAPEELVLDTIEFQACRASGAGGQHVNTTSSAVRAVHRDSGLSVRVESQRSQHANKKLAAQLLQMKMDQANGESAQRAKSQQRKAHHTLERGNPVRVFRGVKFEE